MFVLPQPAVPPIPAMARGKEAVDLEGVPYWLDASCAMRLMVLLYSVCGQGHAAVIAGLLRALQQRDPTCAVLVVSGGLSPPPGCLPAGVDLCQLPGFQPSVGLFSGLVPRAQNLPREVLQKARQRILLSVLRTLQPDLVHCEHYPFGRHAFAKEIDRVLAAAAALGARRTAGLAVLGGRTPEHLAEDLVLQRAQGFDRILVHTDPRVERLDDDYPRAAPLLADRVRYTGYVLARPWPQLETTQVRARLGVPLGAPLLLVHAGGGRDGAALLRRVLLALPLCQPPSGPPPPFTALVGGAALPEEDASELEALAQRTLGVQARFFRARPDLFECVAAADVVVCMAGYASAAEVLATGTPALLCPRADEEQERRARRLQGLGRAALLSATADLPTVAAALTALFRTPRGEARAAVDLSGAESGAAELLTLGAQATARAGGPGGA